MPIDSDTMRKPAFVKYEEGYTIARVDNNQKFMDFSQYPRSYRYGKFLQEGFNPGQSEYDVRDININVDGLVLTPR